MDQVKIGKFIKEQRKAKGLTQAELAEQLSVSDKTVSKWETGNGLPEVTFMLPLCELLDISVNELLSGETLSDVAYKEKAEQNIMNLVQERQQNKQKIILAVIIAVITLLGGISLILFAGLLEVDGPVRIAMIAIALIIIVLGIGVCCVLDNQAGAFECRNCGKRFVPSMTAYVIGPHSLTTRWLKCPHCGKSSFCKKRLTLKNNHFED